MYSYTRAENRERGKLFRKGFRQALADNVDPALRQRIDSIDQSAAERGERELNALYNTRGNDRQAVAQAKAAVRTAPREEKAAARQALKDAEQQLKRSERAVNKAENF
ncbi:hypothetical protein J7F02_05960 [Streptomyces sp. ISL-112]|uniref:hypothetical protein n=1 Tax=unclassified Streptomyces TaxID=2593676 RepID=UPI001BE955C2|nr:MULTISPECIES: hypothetical protein [unclassified Streptomyces]MBT2425242.1 hypothetical protein [Streptomyces sp. ISL-112]MBT2462033.1 hypothetical protein [Streptomyces sp. ISL-63]